MFAYDGTITLRREDELCQTRIFERRALATTTLEALLFIRWRVVGRESQLTITLEHNRSNVCMNVYVNLVTCAEISSLSNLNHVRDMTST